MPSIKRCVFGCFTAGVTIHNFPNPIKYPERFKQWVNIVGEPLMGLSNADIYGKKKVCDRHFTDKDRNRNSRLNALAVPSLHTSQTSHEPYVISHEPATETSKASSSFDQTLNLPTTSRILTGSETSHEPYILSHEPATEKRKASSSFDQTLSLPTTSQILTGSETFGVPPYGLMNVVFGGAAGALGQTASYPLDIVRRRMQTGRRRPDGSYPCPRISHTLSYIYRTDGWRGFFKGLSMNWVKGPIAVGVSFATYDSIKAFLRDVASTVAV